MRFRHAFPDERDRIAAQSAVIQNKIDIAQRWRGRGTDRVSDRFGMILLLGKNLNREYNADARKNLGAARQER